MAEVNLQPDVGSHAEEGPKHWPVPLAGCLQLTQPGVAQVSRPWSLFLKACFCPATVLGANETLYQEEELADVGCLQPHALCGPTCRDLNAQYCALGNEGLKVCAHMCALQAACSCACIGSPCAAWLTALQRQQVAAKHGIDDSNAWHTTACYPCSLVQVHTLLQQERAQYSREPAAAPHKPPKVQEMTGAAALLQAPSNQAPSMQGPLTSGISTSRVLRAVHTQSARGGSITGRSGPGGSAMGGDDSSSEASSGVVDSGLRQAEQLNQLKGSQFGDSHSAETASTAMAAPTDAEQQQRSSSSPLKHSRGASPTAASVCSNSSSSGGSSSGGKAPAAASPAAPAAAAVISTAALQGPLSARVHRLASRSNAGTDGSGLTPRAQNKQQQQPHVLQQAQLPPRPRPSHGHRRSLSGGTMHTSNYPEPGATATSAVGSPTAAQNNSGSSSSSNRAAEGTAAAETSDAAVQVNNPTASIPANSTSSPGLAASEGLPLIVSESSIDIALPGARPHGSSCSGLLALSQEDVPLLAIKPSPARTSRRTSVGLGSSQGTLGPGLQRQGGPDQPIIAAVPPVGLPADPTSSRVTVAGQFTVAVQSAAVGVEVSGAAGTDTVYSQQQQYGTLQSDVCNFASSLGATSPSSVHVPYSDIEKLHQQQQPSQSHPSAAVAATPPQQAVSYGEILSKDSGSLDTQLPGKEDSEQISGALSGGNSPGDSLNNHETTSTATAAGQATTADAARPRMPDWAYMSDLCNLGGSFDVHGSSCTTLAAALTQYAGGNCELAEVEAAAAAVLEGGSKVQDIIQQYEQQQRAQQQQQQDINKRQPGIVMSAGIATSSQQQQQASRALGSWPDAAPSPPFATIDAAQAQQQSPASGLAGSAAATISNTSGGTSTEAHTGCRSAQIATGLDVASAGSVAAQPEAAAVSTQTAAPSGRVKLDSHILAAVTGRSDTRELTASQEDLAAKLARLAFATAGGAKQQQEGQQQQKSDAVGSFQQQQQISRLQQPSSNIFERQHLHVLQALEETFYPTIVSDICNLAEPSSTDASGAVQTPTAVPKATESNWSVVTSPSNSGPVSVQRQHQQQQQQQQQQQLQHGRPPQRPGARGYAVQKSSAATGAGDAAAASSGEAGPLKSALLRKTGQQPKQSALPLQFSRQPGMARQVGADAANGSSKSNSGANKSGAAVAASVLESIDSYSGRYDTISAGSARVSSRQSGKTYTVTSGGAIIETAGVSQFHVASDEGAGSKRLMISRAGSISPSKSPERHLQAAGALSSSASHADCSTAAENDVRAGRQDVSRCSSPAIGGGKAQKGSCVSVQTSTALWANSG